MSDDLVTYLDWSTGGGSTPGRGRQATDVVKRFQRCAEALVERSMTTEVVAGERPDFCDLASALIVAYGSEELEELYDKEIL